MEFFLLGISLLITLAFTKGLLITLHLLNWFQLPNWLSLIGMVTIFAWCLADE